MPPADPAAPGRLSNDSYVLLIRQSPEKGKVVGPKEKASDRKPIDPPPIIQLRIRDPNDPAQNYLQSPYYFMCCSLWDPSEDRPANGSANDAQAQSGLAGTVASSLHRLKDTDNTDGGFFVFGDLSVRIEGRFRLRFNLFEMMQGTVVCLQSIVSSPFTVYSAKSFPGMNESTFLSRSFGDQGVRLRIRKEARAQKRPTSRGQTSGDSNAYAATSRAGVASTQATMGYGQTSYAPTARDYSTDFSEPPGKRQRSSGPNYRSMYETTRQDAWPYSQAPQQLTTLYSSGSHAASPYAHDAHGLSYRGANGVDSTSQASQGVNLYASQTPQSAASYSGDGTSTPLQTGMAAFRNGTNGADSSLVQQSYLPRSQMSEYASPPTSQVAYDPSRSAYGAQSAGGAQSGYGSASQGMGVGMNQHGHPSEGMNYPDMGYGMRTGI